MVRHCSGLRFEKRVAFVACSDSPELNRVPLIFSALRTRSPSEAAAKAFLEKYLHIIIYHTYPHLVFGVWSLE